MAPAFRPGIELCRDFYRQAVGPLLDEAYPGLPYAAARIGPGSDVLGYDTARSVDHDWGPRLELFLQPEDRRRHGAALHQLLSDRLPRHYDGWSTHFLPAEGRVRSMSEAEGPLAHRVHITDLTSWCAHHLGTAPTGEPTTLDWLATPTQRLAETTGGEVYHDTTGALRALRQRLRRYPTDILRYLLSCQWARLSEEEPFVGRAAESGDELGSRLLTARLARDVMRLCLLLEHRYPPYNKWLGTAFARLPRARQIGLDLTAALTTEDPRSRQDALCRAYRGTAQWQNGTGLAATVDPTPRRFHDRPYQILGAERFSAALRTAITDPQLRELPPVGGIDQYLDSTAVLTDPARCRALMATALDLPG